MDAIQRISAEELKARLNDFAVYDVRETGEFSNDNGARRINGSINVPLGELVLKVSAADLSLRNDDKSQCVLVCSDGLRSLVAALSLSQLLTAQTEKANNNPKEDGTSSVYVLDGGLEAWNQPAAWKITSRSSCDKCPCTACQTASCVCRKECEFRTCSNAECSYEHCSCGSSCSCADSKSCAANCASCKLLKQRTGYFETISKLVSRAASAEVPPHEAALPKCCSSAEPCCVSPRSCCCH